MNVLMPSYYVDFKCRGAECEDTCCKYWNISIDKATYKKYKKLKPSSLKLLMDNSVKREKGSNDYRKWAKIVLDSKGYCPFLKDGLCRVYSELGADNMCNTCKTYHRCEINLGSRLEYSLSTACIEASRLILTKKEGLDFVSCNITEGDFNTKFYVDADLSSKGKIGSNFSELREFAIDVVQNRSLSLEHRLMVLGVVFKEICGVDELSTKLREVSYHIQDGVYDNIASRLHINESVQIDLVTYICQYINGIDGYFSNCYTELKEALLCGLYSDGIFDVKKYKKGKECYNKLMLDYSYIVENYVVNYIFYTLFPLSTTDLYSSCMSLLMNIALLKIYLIGLCANKGDSIVGDDIVRAISGYSSVVNHSSTVIDTLNGYLNENNILTLPYVVTILL